MKKLLVWVYVISMMACSRQELSNLPNLVSVEPRTGIVGDRIILSGSILNSSSEVTFYAPGETISAGIISQSESRLEVIVPSVPPGNKLISVRNSAGESNRLPFEVLLSDISILSISPSEGKPGDILTILGTNLNLVKIVKFSDGKSGAAKYSNVNGRLKVEIPSDAVSGTVCLYTDRSKICSAHNIIIQTPPIIEGISSDKGVENSRIEILGSGLANVKVYFGNVLVSPSKISESSVEVLCPKFTSVQQVNLVVKNTSGEASVIFTGAPASKILTTVPNGLIPGGALTLKGSNFFEVQSVLFSDKKTVSANEFFRVESNEVTFKVPAGSNAARVTVVSQYGTGEDLALNLINGGAGLNSDNIANSVNQMTSISFLNNGCGTEKYQYYYIRGRKVGFFHNFAKYDRTQECFNKYEDILPTTEVIGGQKFLVLTTERGYNNPFKDPDYEYKLKISYSSEYYNKMTYNGPTQDYGTASQTEERISMVILEERHKVSGHLRVYFGNPFSRANSQHQLLIELIAADNSSLVICQPDYRVGCSTEPCQACLN